MTTEAPAFDSTRKALVFALNYEPDGPKSPLMNTAMAEVKPGEKTGRQWDDEPRQTKNPNRPSFQGLDKAHQAGLIMQLVSRLNREHQRMIEAILVHPRAHCVCGRACCRGWSYRPVWRKAVHCLVDIVKDHADLMKVPGKKGMSTDPRLRRILIEDYLKPEEKRQFVTDMAKATEVTSATVIKHRALIYAYLDQLQGEAFAQIAIILDEAGVTGAFD
jgi:hypothetical protein